ncbi:hypothetical protein ACEQ8H_001334 [Pleosporales sp. CAS-2024a]
MSPTKLGVFANMALAASAVLLPPTITGADLSDNNMFQDLVVNPLKQSVVLQCPGCAVATKTKDELVWKEKAGNAFRLDFEIGGKESTLQSGDYQLFPPSFNEGVPSFYVTQVDSHTDEPLRLLVTGYTFRFHGAQTISDEGTEMLPMTLQIGSVNGVAVNPPVLTINILKDVEGRLMIASLDNKQPAAATRIGEVVSQGKDCNKWPLLCRWKSIVGERIEKMKKLAKGCHKHGHSHMDGERFHGKPPHRFRPDGPGHGQDHTHHHLHHMHHMHHGQPMHHMHHGHYSHQHMHVFARRAFYTIVLPIIVGVFCGVTVYLVAMVLCTLVAIIIAKVRGQEYQRIALEEEDVEQGRVEEVHVTSEKQEYAELPAYDAPPVYEEEAEAENKTDESK